MIARITELIKQRYKLILIVILVLTGSWLFYQRRIKPEETELSLEKPQYRNLTKTLEVSGLIDAKRKARLRFIAGGKITYLGAQEGELVDQWQTIATIDQRDLQKRLEQGLNNYMKERWDWEQQLDDIEHRWIDKEEQRQVEKNQWNLENRVIDVELQNIAISNTVMSSPIKGILVQSPINIAGVQVLGSDYFEIVDPKSLIFKAEVDEEDIAKLKKEQSAKIRLDAYPNETLRSKINYIAYSSNQGASGTVFIIEFPIQTELDTPLNKYRLGMNGDAEIEIARTENVLTIPFIATKLRDDKTYVDIQTETGEIEEKEIKTGLETEEWIEVKSGLSEESQVVIPQSE